MRVRVWSLIAVSILCITAGVFWGVSNFAAQPATELIDRAYSFVAIGASHVRGEWIEDAARLFARAADIEPSDAEAHLMAALAFQVTGDYDRALAHYEAAKELAGGLAVDALIGELFAAQGDWEAAEAAYQRALELDGESRLSLMGLARVVEGQGRLADAEHYLRRVVELSEGDLGAYIELSKFFRRTGQAEAALSALEDVPEGRRAGAVYYAELGFVYESLGRQVDACTQLRSALRVGSSDPEVTRAIERLGCRSRSE